MSEAIAWIENYMGYILFVAFGLLLIFNKKIKRFFARKQTTEEPATQKLSRLMNENQTEFSGNLSTSLRNQKKSAEENIKSILAERKVLVDEQIKSEEVYKQQRLNYDARIRNISLRYNYGVAQLNMIVEMIKNQRDLDEAIKSR